MSTTQNGVTPLKIVAVVTLPTTPLRTKTFNPIGGVIRLISVTTTTMMPNQTPGEDWMKQFITGLLHITHLQIVFCNFSLRDHQRGLLRRHQHEEKLAKIKQLTDTSPDEVPAESRFLLEFDLSAFRNADLDTQQ